MITRRQKSLTQNIASFLTKSSIFHFFVEENELVVISSEYSILERNN